MDLSKQAQGQGGQVSPRPGNDQELVLHAMRLAPKSQPSPPDTCVAFRGTFDLSQDAEISLDIFGAHWFVVHLDGVPLTEGPYRFPVDHPEYEIRTLKFRRGRHVIAAEVRNEGVSTQILSADTIPAFFLCRARVGERSIPVHWKRTALTGYVPSGQRINSQLGWILWIDTRRNPNNWQALAFNDAAWQTPEVCDEIASWHLMPVRLGAVQSLDVTPRLIGEGKLSGPFDGADKPDWKTDDDLPWYRRDLKAEAQVNGIWKRYDLGYVMLGRPEVRLDVPPGTVVEIAYSETLQGSGGVTPRIPRSARPSRNLDHFVARGGAQTFVPMVPRGGRYFEVHVQAYPSSARFLATTYRRRTYFGDPFGTFQCDDDRLNHVWQLGINTLRACAEDSAIDNPTRQRGQWFGDVLQGSHVAKSAYNDLRLFRRCLEQSAYCADGRGLVAGVAPSGLVYISTYAAQWLSAVFRYYEVTGDRTLLEALYPYALRNMDAIGGALGPNGVGNDLAWAFVDWGYAGTPDHATDIALNLHVLEGVRSFQRWQRILGKDTTKLEDIESKVKAAVLGWLVPRCSGGNWNAIGYHRTVLALRSKLIPAEFERAAAEAIKQHIVGCFPSNPDAPRYADPQNPPAQVITPYFASYAFPVLIDAGEIDFVQSRYRDCWGWALDQGLTTQPEVFDLNWSHCHVLGCCPTAQLTEYVLGLSPKYSLGEHHFEVTLNPGRVTHASGIIPLPNRVGGVAVDWKRTGTDIIDFEVRASVPIVLHLPGETEPYATMEGRGRVTFKRPVSVGL